MTRDIKENLLYGPEQETLAQYLTDEDGIDWFDIYGEHGDAASLKPDEIRVLMEWLSSKNFLWLKRET